MEKKISFPDKEPLIESSSDFINSIIKKKEPLAGAELSVKVTQILERVR